MKSLEEYVAMARKVKKEASEWKNQGQPRPYIEEGFLRPLDPVEILDAFFSQVVMPRLSRLSVAGRLPDLLTCPLWREVDRLWQVSTPDVERIKRAMEAALDVY